MKVLDAQLSLAQATLDASALTAPRTFALPDAAGTLALQGFVPSVSVLGSYTLQASDVGKEVRVGSGNSQSAATVTIDASVLSAGDVIWVRRNWSDAADRLLLAGASGTSLFAAGNPAITRNYGLVRVYIPVAATAEVSGDLAQNIINAQTGTAYTLSRADQYGGTTHTNASPITVTVAADFSQPYNVGAVIPIRQGGAGVVTIVSGSSVTINAPHGNSTNGVGDVRVLERIARNVYNLY